MSAFIVNNYHIDVLVNYAVFNRLYYCHNDKVVHCEKNPDVIGQVLLAENYRSVNHRYEENDTAPSYKFRVLSKSFSAIQIIKACNCLEYQSCEHDEWKDSEAYKIVNSIREHAIINLKEYEDAQWEIPEPDEVPDIQMII